MNPTNPPQAKLVKNVSTTTGKSDIVAERKAQLLERMRCAQSELGRLNKLFDEMRADVLHLTLNEDSFG